MTRHIMYVSLDPPQFIDPSDDDLSLDPPRPRVHTFDSPQLAFMNLMAYLALNYGDQIESLRADRYE